MSSIQALIGLGNPGERYCNTRHNVGARLTQLLLTQHNGQLKSNSKVRGDHCLLKIDGMPLHCLIPHSYMNESGNAVAALCQYYGLQPDQLLIAQDEMDLPAGTMRLKRDGGHGGHNGIRDIQRALGGRSNFSRLRIGVGHPGQQQRVIPHLLSPIDNETMGFLQHGMHRALDIIPALMHDDWDAAVRQLHSPAPASPDEAGRE